VTTITIDAADFEDLSVHSEDLDAKWAAFGSDLTGSVTIAAPPGTNSQMANAVVLRRLGAIPATALPAGVQIVAVRMYLDWSHAVGAGTAQVTYGDWAHAQIAPHVLDLAVDSGTVSDDTSTWTPDPFTSGPIDRATFLASYAFWGWTFATTAAGAGWAASLDVTDFHLEIDIALPPVSADPTVGGILGGDPVTVTGSGFAVDATVTFDGTLATDVVVVDATTITCVTPAHATTGVVDVVVTNVADGVSGTGVAGFTYSAVGTTPSVDAGPVQRATAPLPSVVTTAPTIVRGSNNGTLTYAWTQLSGPATATITDPTARDTDLVFDAFVPGTYVFELTVTDEPEIFVVTHPLTVLMGPTVPPRVGSGRRHLVWSV
jgi:hypothetical protein